VLEFRVRVKVKVRVQDSWGTKRLDTKRLGSKMSGSRSPLSPNTVNVLVSILIYLLNKRTDRPLTLTCMKYM